MNTVLPASVKTFNDLLAFRASAQPDALAFRFLSYTATDVEEECITYQGLDKRARLIAQQLLTKCQPGDRALMLYPSGIDFIAAYFGCLYAGVIAVPGYPPKRNQKLGRLKSLMQSCQAKVAMTDLQTQLIAEPQFGEVEELKSLSWVITDTLAGVTTDGMQLPHVHADDIAFLQYTSGSTGDPKGVMVTHANLMANSRSIYAAMGHGSDSVAVGWLPLFHDMGLIGNVLQPIYAGIPSTLMAPASFLQRPMRWLEAMTKYRATASGGPNFGYDLCVHTIKDEDLAKLDLSAWSLAFNGAEPIRPESLRAFSEKFSACGFKASAQYACYGMAETTLLITGSQPGEGVRTTYFDDSQLQKKRAVAVDADHPSAHELVSCGKARCEQGVLIINPESMTPCEDGHVGEVWAYGESNAKGYWQRADVTEAIFAAHTSDTKAGPYLRTGDLGFLHQGELYIAGRLKDVLIIRGANHYPQDIELTAFESHEAFMPNGAAAFTIEEQGEEKLVVVLEVRRTHLRSFDAHELARAIQQAVVLNHELQVQSIVFIKPGQLPKTSSGKVQRQSSKQQFLAGEIESIGRIDKSADVSTGALKTFDKEAWQALPEAGKLAAVADYIAALFEAYAKLPAGAMQRDVAFIGYGLDSLALTQIAARVSEELDINLQVQNLFEYETVDALAAALNGKLRDPASKRQSIVSVANAEQRYPLSFAQQRMWFLMQYEETALYNISGVLRIAGDLDINALDKSFREIIRRHDALRTRFVVENFEPVQVIGQEVDWKLSVIDISDRGQDELDAAIDKELNFIFDLSEDMLFRTAVYKQPDGAYSLVVCMHHIISDGWSVSVLMNELAVLYAAYAQGQASPLHPMPIQYPDYAVWQRGYLTGDVLQRQEDYWKSQLQGVEPIMLPTFKLRPTTQTHAGNSIALQLDADLTQHLKTLSKEQGVTLYMTLLAAFGVLLHKYSGQDDICVGTPIANRTMAETKDLVGFFVNTLALRANYGGDPLFRDVLKNVKTVTTEAYAHQDLPFEKVVDLVQTERDLATSPLFQVMFALQDVDMGSLVLPGVQVQKTPIASKTSKFDLTLELVEGPDGLTGHLEYKTDLFDEAAIATLSSHFKHLLTDIVNAPDSRLSSLSLLEAEERRHILESFNDTAVAYPRNLTLHQLFESQVARSPNHTALIYEGVSLTYAELNAKANQLAHYLRSQGVGPEVLVGVCTERSIEMVIALYGILKAGGAYVPFDPAYPKDRLTYMMEDARPAVLLTQHHLVGNLPATDTAIFCVDTQWPLVQDQPTANPHNHTHDANLAYVIFTSGSTGRPKGVAVEHAGVVNLLQWMQAEYKLTASDRFLQKTPFSFDVSVSEFFWPLQEGATLVMAKPGGHQDVDYLADVIRTEGITTIDFVSPMLEVFLNSTDMQSCASLRQIFCAGQALPLELQQRCFAKLPHVALHNLYGPTEASVYATYWQCREASGLNSVPIGYPLANTQNHILDNDLNPVPVGVAGELHIAGIGLARGYLNRPDLTAEKFIPNPFSKVPGARMYKSGDLSRYLPDGTIEYLGRIDDQVKIRGFRIELGEIENGLAGLPNVRDAIVMAREDVPGDKRIVAYIVPQEGGKEPNASDLRAALAGSLPEYMVPAHFIFIDQVPLTPNGKVNRKALPAPDVQSLLTSDYVAPRNALESALATIWGDVLALDNVSVNANFFEVGGHSLLAVQMVSRVKDTLGLPINIRDVFTHKTIESLAAHLSQKKAEEQTLPAVAKRDESGRIPLSLDQKPYWFLHQLEGGSHTYNIQFAMRVHGELDVRALERSFHALIERHESLRTRFPTLDGEPMQEIVAADAFKLQHVNIAEGEIQAMVQADFTYIFDLANSLPLRVRLLKVNGTDHVITFVVHHAVADGWSLNILYKELVALYSGFSKGEQNPLPSPALQYGDYSEWQHKYVIGEYYDRQIAFWKKKLEGVPPLLNLPLDYSRPPVQSYRGKEVPISLPAGLTASLNQYARQHNTTLFNLLLSGLAILLSRYGRTNDVPIGTAVANRIQKELEPLVGCFANTMVIRCRLEPSQNFEHLVAAVSSEALDAFSNSSVPFDGVVEAIQPQRSLGIPPIFQVMFRLHTQGIEETNAFANLNSELIKFPVQSAKLDLNFSMNETPEGIKGVIEYATDIFSEQTVARIARHFQTVLEAALANSTVPIENLCVVTQDEIKQVQEWNSTQVDYPKNECMHHLFERTVERTPNKLAYVCGNDRFTYAELNVRANRLAHFLKSRGVGPEVRVGVSVERSTWAGIGALGVFKSGGTYVPLDINYPKDRIARMLEVAKPNIILTLSSIAPLFDGTDAEVICLDTGWDAIQSQPISNPERIGADHSAYILFTSGTTGKPKGILVAHKSFRNMAVAHRWTGLHTPDSRVLQFASLSFSISLWGAFMAWVPGGTLYSVNAKQALPDEPLYDFLEENQITHATWPVSFLSTVPVDRMPKSLRTVISSAEPCNDAVVAKWTALGIRFLNMYGNSEVSIGSTLYEYKQIGEKLTIGKAFPNTQMYLLDDQLLQVPIGVIAEIHTAGAGLATCYVGDPVATAKSFIPNPFGDGWSSRMYKTGDLGRYLPNGEIEFIGREDFQVSIRGFRVELTEIEDVLRAVPGVREVVVNSRDDQQGLARLVCFYTHTDDAKDITSTVLRQAVSEKLPNYMVPSIYVALDGMPLTPNRKVDRLALQSYSINDGDENRYVAPTSRLEKQLALIWSDVLDIEDIGIRQDFFELGGHSLLATRIVARIRSELHVELSLQQFFENSTIERLAILIGQANTQYLENPIRILENRDNVPLSFAQQRLWFLDRYEENSNFYHMPILLKIAGDLDVEALNKTFVSLIERHEALRTNFIAHQGQGFQKIHPSIDWSMGIVEIEGASIAEQEAQLSARVHEQLSTNFNLETDALLRVVLYKFSAQEYRLFVNIHHIISDGWSTAVMINEVAELYTAYVSNRPHKLKDLPVQYADYAVSQIEYLQGPVLGKQARYWSKKLNDLTNISLPVDFERPRHQTYNGDQVAFEIDKVMVDALEQLSSQQGATLFMTMLSAFKLMLTKYSGDTDISIGTPIANRVRPEIEPLIGFFANTLALRSDLDGNPTFAELLQRVKQTTLEAYSNQDIPFEKVVDLVLKERDPSRSPLFQVSFGLQKNWMPTSIALPGVTMDFVTLENKTSKFDLVLEFFTSPEEGLAGYFEYNTDLFKRETVESFVRSLMNLLQQIVADPIRKLSAFSLSSGNEVTAKSIKLADHPILLALYGDAGVVAENPLGYYLLDDAGMAVPSGAIGQLYVDVADQPGLSEQFGNAVADMAIGGQQAKWLKTGFTARESADGLQLLSSADQVALINGSLVYPRVIGQKILSRPDVQDCHVAVRRHAELGDQLVVYLVCENDEPEASDFTQFLQLAGFTGIQIFACVKVGAIPLNKYGQVNSKQLYKYAVHHQATRQLWSEKICHLEKISQAVVVSQIVNEQQPVSHLLDLLPAEARGIGSSAATVVSKTKKVGQESISTLPAVIISEPILDVIRRPKTLADMLFNTVELHGDKAMEFYYSDNSTVTLTYAQLLHKAQCVLTGLRDAGLSVGSKVIFQFDRNEDFVVAFWACELGGYIPVPIAAAKSYRSSNAQTVKVAHAWNMMDHAIILAGANTYDGVCNVEKLETIDNFDVHDITAMVDNQPAREFHHGASDDVALIMLTSGSTGLPKGVQLTHANLIGRTLGSAQLNGFQHDMVSLNWMALDHVGGIIYFHIRDTYLGATQIHADTDYILADPLRWLQLIDQHRVNITWAPNFAFALIVERQDGLKKLTLDLSCLKFMLNGAEAVVPKTTQTFIELMQQFRMAEDTVKPVFGMSEISSGVTYAKRLQLTYGSDDTVFVSVGRPIPGVNMRIVDEHDQPMMEGQSGRLQVSGVTVTKGYLGAADVNKDTFTQDGWFKTGDLAFIQNGELTITGREKDVIIINGVNFYSHEIAEVVETVPGVVVSYTGACAVRRSGSNSDQLAIFFNTAQKGDALLVLIRQIRLAVIEKIGINPSYILSVEKDQIPKTEIGKIQLTKLAQSFNRGQFDQAMRTLDLLERNDNTLPDWSFSKAWVHKQLDNVVELPPAGATLVLADTAGLATALRVHGRLITVTRGSAYRELDDAYQFNPSIKEHYTQLVTSLAQRSIVISRVVNLWDYDSDASKAQAFMTRATLSDAIGMYSAWYLAQAFAEQDNPSAMRWIWAARMAQRVGNDDLISPDKAATLALLKSLSKEFSWLKCHHVDFEGDDTAAHAVQLSQEFSTFHAIDEVAYRGDKRLVVRLRKERRVVREKREMPLVVGAAYMISGGLGGIGYELAKMLLKQFNAKLLLVGRTPQEQLSAEKKDMLDQLGSLGSVLYAGADICNHAALESAVEKAEDHWKQKLAGVFHLAGLAHEEAMARQPIHSLHDVLRAKTTGTRVLYNLCNRRTDTLFVNFSSVNGFFGGSGMAAYSIGNRYQEAFVESVRGNKNVNSICISWSLWHDTGMGSKYKQAESLSKALGFTPILASKGLFSLLTVLYHGRRNVLIGLDDTKPNIRSLATDVQPRGEQLVCYFAASEPGITNEVAAEVSLTDEFGLPLSVQYVQVDALPQTESGAIDVNALRKTFAQSASAKAEKIAPRDELEETLSKIATTVFDSAEPIGIKDNFFDVGATSLLIVKLHHEIQQQLDVQFPLVELFNSTSIEKLAIFLGQLDNKEQPTAADAARAAGQDRRAAMQRRNRSRERKTAR